MLEIIEYSDFEIASKLPQFVFYFIYSSAVNLSDH